MLWGGRNTVNKYHWRVWGVLAVSGPHWICPAHGVCAFPVYIAQALGCSAGNCLRWALGCMHFPGLSCSGSASRVLHKGTDLVGPAFCAFPRSEQLRWPGAWRAHSHPVGGCILSPPPSQPLSFMGYKGHSFSGVPCVSSRELISGCDPHGRYQPSTSWQM